MSCPTCGRPYGQRKRCYYCSQKKRRTGRDVTCEVCGATFYVQPNVEAQGGGKYCSRACKHTAQRGVELAPGTKYVRSDGYVAVKVGIRRYDLEHRIVMSAALGRPLSTDEQVHHINGIRDDNRLENLQVITNAEHQRLHQHPHIYQRKRVKLTCHRCGKEYEVKASRAKESLYCSNACRLPSLHERNRKE